MMNCAHFNGQILAINDMGVVGGVAQTMAMCAIVSIAHRKSPEVLTTIPKF